MKSKKLNKKLSLNMNTVVNLDAIHMANALGGHLDTLEHYCTSQENTHKSYCFYRCYLPADSIEHCDPLPAVTKKC